MSKDKNLKELASNSTDMIDTSKEVVVSSTNSMIDTSKEVDTSKTRKQGKPILRRLLKYVRPHIGYLILALFLSIAQIVCVLFIPVITGQAIDGIIGKNNVDFGLIFSKVIIIGILIAIAAVCQWIAGLCTNKVSYLTIRDLREEAFRKLNFVPLKFIDNHSHGDIMSRLSVDIDSISDGLIQGFTQLFTGIVTIVGTLIFMLSVNLTVTAVVVLVTPISIFVAYFIAKGCHKMFYEQSRRRGEMTGLAEEMLTNQRVVKAFSYENRAEEKFDGINSELKKCGTKAMFYSAMVNPATRFVNGLVYAGVCVVGTILAIKGIMSVGEVSCFLAYANQYTKPFNEVTGVITELQTAMSAARRVFEVLDEEEEKSDIGFKERSGFVGNIEAKDVDFSYVPDRPLIDNFNVNVTSGMKVAIVGPTGCGKTTLINLLMRFYDADKGTIYIDGEDVTTLTRKSVRRAFGMVLQDTWLFKGTVADNIAYGKPDATMDEIVAAAKRSRIHGLISRMENGYDTIISDDDSISQGQKQLICIARIMLCAPPMLILDEATSNIDTRTEIKIQEAFNELMQGRTSFIIAHRLSTIKDADLILVMRDGNVVEKGTHNELMNKAGFYSELYKSGYEPST